MRVGAREMCERIVRAQYYGGQTDYPRFIHYADRRANPGDRVGTKGSKTCRPTTFPSSSDLRASPNAY